MRQSKDELLGLIRNGEAMTASQQLRLTILLAVPSIIAQLASVLLQYIDAAMVGNLGANPSASIGLVSTSTWIFNGFFMAVCSGFSVQIAQHCGANDFKGARRLLREGMGSSFIFGLFIAIIGVLISSPLPFWLGGNDAICADATDYFRIYSIFLPVASLGYMLNVALLASGNAKVPSMLFIFMAVLDVIFNYIFIYAMDWGVPGAAMGTGVAQLITAILSFWYICVKSKDLSILGETGSFIPGRSSVRTAFGITGPLFLQNIVMRGAFVVSTLIVAPLGAVSIAANTFAITAESFCYMPGYGFEESATTLIGQSLGARRKDIAKRFAKINIGLAAILMTFLGILMYFFAEALMSFMSNDPEVIALGARVLRIEAFAETFYAVSMVAYGCCVGAGDTIMPSVLNFASMWVVRIGLALLLTPTMGLLGYWIAMCIELNVRGLLFLWRIRGGKWLNKNIIKSTEI